LVQVTSHDFELVDGSVLVPFTITNASDAAVYLAACADRPRIAIDRRRGLQWHSHIGGHCLTVNPTAPLPLERGGAYSYVVSVGAEDTGVFRLRFGVSHRVGESPNWTATSNAFVVR
jgi:hypothetical protein